MALLCLEESKKHTKTARYTLYLQSLNQMDRQQGSREAGARWCDGDREWTGYRVDWHAPASGCGPRGSEDNVFVLFGIDPHEVGYGDDAFQRAIFSDHG